MTKELGRVYWKECVKPDMYDDFIENVVIKSAGADIVDGLQEFSIKRSDGLEIYVPSEDIKEYIKRRSQ